MPNAYFVVPLHTITSNENNHPSADAALGAAARLVEKDRQPRAVVLMVGEARTSPTPRVDVRLHQETSDEPR